MLIDGSLAYVNTVYLLLPQQHDFINLLNNSTKRLRALISIQKTGLILQS